MSVGVTEDSKEEGCTLEDQEAAELEEKLPDQTQPTKEVSGCFLTLKEKKRKEKRRSDISSTLLLCFCALWD